MAENRTTFVEIVENDFDQLDLYTTAITRAHGKSHPEAFDVRHLFEDIQAKVKTKDIHATNLTEEFIELRKITKNYTIPDDVCETYASVYEMLSKTDQLYHDELNKGGISDA